IVIWALGPNAFSLAENIVGVVKEVCQKMTKPVPEFLVLLNEAKRQLFSAANFPRRQECSILKGAQMNIELDDT
ncbi:hypothetical protein Taro_030328, partial [Colocasia esculenta]|nr:hypothetical protein [Colocasia esculenta]